MCVETAEVDDMPQTLGAEDGAIVGLGSFGFVVLIVLIVTVGRTITKTTTVRHREQSRREIAAYVAEGSISPDDAVKMLAAGQGASDVLREKSS